MRIAISTPAYPLPGDLTRGRYIYEIACCLSRLATVEVFFHTARYPSAPWLRPRSYVPVKVDGDLSTTQVKATAFHYPSLPVVSRAVNGYVSGKALLARLRPFRPDLVLGYWIYPEGYGAWRCARTLGVPCVLGALGTDIRVRGGLTGWFTGLALRAADRLIVVSEEMRGVATGRYAVDPSRVHTITNGVNSEIFHPRAKAAMRAHLGLPAGARIVLYVGRFVPSKGLRELLDAFAVLAGSSANLYLVLIGDGVMREELHARVASAPWGANVRLTGAMRPEAIAQWIGAADLLCLPSYSEGYPNVVVEALACGRPVVATAVGGIPEIVNVSNGRLVPARDAISLRNALQEVLGREWDEQALAAACSRSWEDVARDTLAVCRQACSQVR